MLLNFAATAGSTPRAIYESNIWIMKSKVLFLLVDWDVVRSGLWLDGWGSDATIAPPCPDHELFLTKLSPIWHSFLSAPLPLVLSKDPILLNHLPSLKLLHFSGIIWLLQSDDLVFLIVDLFEYFMAHFLILCLECVGRQGLLTIFNSFLVLLFSLKLCAFSSLFHDSQVNLPFFRVD